MNSQWMTSLRKNFEQVQSQIKSELENRGLRMTATDVAALIEEMAPAASRATLSAAMDFLRPFTAGLGLRVSRLSDTQIEIIIPARTRNLNEDGAIHESVMNAAAIEAAKLLWLRHAPLGDFSMQVTAVQFEFHRASKSEVRVRLEIPETARENNLSQMRQGRESISEMSLRFVDVAEQEVAQATLRMQLRHRPALEAPETEG